MLDSNGEIKIHDILEDADVPFEEEYTFPDLVSSSGRHLRFDFAVFRDDGELDYLIEFNGKQHYTASPRFGGARGLYRQQYNDNEKRKYCLKNNITLVTIPYFDEGRITYEYILRAAGY